MISVLTVCGNGIGSSLMLKMKIEEICAENGIDAQVESIDFNAAQGRKADLIVTVKELAEQFDDKNVAIVRSYINKKKITEEVYNPRSFIFGDCDNLLFNIQGFIEMNAHKRIIGFIHINCCIDGIANF